MISCPSCLKGFPNCLYKFISSAKKENTWEKHTYNTQDYRHLIRDSVVIFPCRLCLNCFILIVRHCRHCPKAQSATEQSPISPWVNFKTDWLRLPFLDSSTDWDPNLYHPAMDDINDIHAAGTSTYILIRQHPGWLLMNNMDPSHSTSRYFWTPLIGRFLLNSVELSKSANPPPPRYTGWRYDKLAFPAAVAGRSLLILERESSSYTGTEQTIAMRMYVRYIYIYISLSLSLPLSLSIAIPKVQLRLRASWWPSQTEPHDIYIYNIIYIYVYMYIYIYICKLLHV